MNTVPAPVEIVVDSANVMGSRPDGWWRDRAAAATRLVQALAALPGTVLPAPNGVPAPNGAPAPDGVPAPDGASTSARHHAPAIAAPGGTPTDRPPTDRPPTDRPVSGRPVPEDTGHGVTALQVERVVAVVEGQARQIPPVSGVSLVRATADGDGAVVQACESVLAGGGVPVAVTADRGLRARLPAGTVVAGPRWLLSALDGQSRNVGSAGGISTSI